MDENRRNDIIGLGIIVFGIVAGLGTYLSSAGLIGQYINSASGAVVGLGRYLVPVLCIGLGGLFIHGFEFERDEEIRSVRGPLIGLGIIASAVLALIDVVSQPVGIETAGADAFRDYGGLFGHVVGSPLASLLGTIGAGVLLVALMLVGVTMATSLTLAMFGSYGWLTIQTLGSHVGSFLGGLFRVGPRNDADEYDDEYGEYEDDEPIDVTTDATLVHKSSSEVSDKTEVMAKSKRTPKKPEQPTMVVAHADSDVGEQLEMVLEPRLANSPWKLPPLSLLSRSKAQRVDESAIKRRGELLEGALSDHGVMTRLSGMVVGPTVTRYELELGTGVKVNQVVNLAKDIAYAMASPDVRIIAPIPGKQAIGVEVPNEKRQIVALGDILRSNEAMKSKSSLSVAMGRDIEGASVMIDLVKMPHVLIAGQTGAGKSSCINSIMTSVLMRATPDDVRLILVDPKRVELTQYNRVPHLLTEVVTDPKKAANALAWAVAEMERRYQLLEEVGVRDISGYNDAFDAGSLVSPVGDDREFQRLPLILIVVDELADLMMVAARDVEESINRIAAKARAVGVHLVIATQRPSVNVITGVIKANIPARLAFSVASATDSKVIMNTGGAERLVGKGDMLFLDPGSSTPSRVQGCWVEEKEVAQLVKMWRDQSPEVHYEESVQGEENLAAVAQPGSVNADSDDELLMDAMELVVRNQVGSTSMLQRKLRIGFARAGRIMDELEEKGVVSAGGGSKARDVHMSIEEFEELMIQSQ